MISDVLSDAVAGIDGYLNDPRYNQMYPEPFRSRVVALRNSMDATRAELDAPPPLEQSPNNQQ